jgi:hypothetical protein
MVDQGRQLDSNTDIHNQLLQFQARKDKTLDYWLQYVVLFGASHLIPAYQAMPWTVYYNIDLYSVCLVALIMTVYCIKATCRRLYRSLDEKIKLN